MKKCQTCNNNVEDNIFLERSENIYIELYCDLCPKYLEYYRNQIFTQSEKAYSELEYNNCLFEIDKFGVAFVSSVEENYIKKRKELECGFEILMKEYMDIKKQTFTKKSFKVIDRITK